LSTPPCTDCFRRARKPEQIAQRREAILAAMSALLQERKPEDISLNEVAQRAGLAKSNVYRYFDSREAILLELLTQDGRAWMDKAESALAPLRGSGDLAAVARALARITSQETRLCELISIPSRVLERNTSDESVLAFKRHLLQQLGRLVQSMSDALPDLPPTSLARLMHLFVALLSGLWSQSHPVESVRRALTHPDLAPMRVDFEASLELGLTLMLRGLTQA
jgi:TetR/AcrR family transcriptional regulator